MSGTHLQILRKSLGLTQTEAAERMFVSKSSLSRWEKDKLIPTSEQITMIARAYNTDEANIRHILSLKEHGPAEESLEVTADVPYEAVTSEAIDELAAEICRHIRYNRGFLIVISVASVLIALLMIVGLLLLVILLIGR